MCVNFAARSVHLKFRVNNKILMQFGDYGKYGKSGKFGKPEKSDKFVETKNP